MLVRCAIISSTLLLSVQAHAAVVTDPAGDFLPTYAGPANGDLDVISAEVILDNVTNTFTFTGTMNGAIGTTPGNSYVWGLDRGQGTERFVTGSPSIGAGVRFDLVVALRPGGASSINDLAGGGSVPIPASALIISGNTISVTGLSTSLFPSRGFTSSNFTWNLWPRSAGTGNTFIPDFAPDASNAGVTVVPAPGAMALIGLGLLVRGRRSRA